MNYIAGKSAPLDKRWFVAPQEPCTHVQLSLPFPERV